MSDGFERLSRTLGRRSLLKAAGLGALLVVTKPFRASAQTTCPSGTTPCGENCCRSGIACVDASTSRCGCNPGQQACGTGCCEGGAACSNASSACCCAPGTTPCGPTCCAGGVACLDRTNGICGCPSGQTQCYNASTHTVTCCPAGQACGSGGCSSPGSTTNVGCCGHYAAPCENNNQCCTGFCSSQKGNRCGCRSNYDCPANGVCDRSTGICNNPS